MVFYFYPRGHVEGKDDYMIYMGRDKYENEVRGCRALQSAPCAAVQLRCACCDAPHIDAWSIEPAPT